MRTKAKRPIGWALLLLASGVFFGCRHAVYVVQVGCEGHCEQRVNAQTHESELVCTGVTTIDTVVVGGGDDVKSGPRDTVVIGGGG
jgi:hypothetical protein